MDRSAIGRQCATLGIAILAVVSSTGFGATVSGTVRYSDLPLGDTFSAGTFVTLSVRAYETTTRTWTTGTVNYTGSSYAIPSLAPGSYRIYVLLSPTAGRQAGQYARTFELTGARTATVGGEPAVTLDFGLLYGVHYTAPFDSTAVWPGSWASCPYGSEAPRTVTVAWTPVPRAVRYRLYVMRRSCAGGDPVREDRHDTTSTSVTVTQGEAAGEEYLELSVQAIDGDSAVVSTGPVVVYADREQQPAVHLAPGGGRVSGSSGQHLAAAAHVQGVGKAFWQTDLVLSNPTPDDVTTTVYFTPRGANGLTAYHERQVEVAAGHCRTLPDVVSTLFGVSAAGALEVSSPSLVVASRTYSTAATGGTYGQGYLPIPANQRASLGGPTRLVAGGVGKGGVRTNLTLNEVSGQAVKVRVELLDRYGSEVGEREESLHPYGNAQINDIVTVLASLGSLEDGQVRVTVVEGSGTIAATLSVIDSATADPTTIPLEPR